ncbi:MAG: deoxyribonuclease IV [Actinobacteria bacterium]|nr:deoxyribonuclease IV [Actinomycetota bacterium]NBY15936.1 deoxyribonuclease IV [Actinomycetota bacterium]
MSKIEIGAHVGSDDPISDAKALNIPHIQIFCGEPQTFKGATFPHPGGAAGLKEQAIAENIGIYVHARYVINVASANNKVRIPSRKLLQTDVDAAAEIGARAVIVHGGHITADDDPESGFENWAKALNGLDMKVPVLIENTAGGSHAMARQLATISRLWDFVGGSGVGFCLDTCHAHAGGIALGDVAEKIIGITGKIDLIHCNDSRDEFDSGRDRHANLGHGNIDLSEIIHCLTVADAPVILETPSDGVLEDIALLANALN